MYTITGGGSSNVGLLGEKDHKDNFIARDVLYSIRLLIAFW